MLHGEKLKAFPLKSETKQGCLFSIFNIVVVVVLEQFGKKKKKRQSYEKRQENYLCYQIALSYTLKPLKIP